jgi:hypothetical protein
MVRISKKAERRAVSFRRPKLPGKKTGPLKDNLPKGFKEHQNLDPSGENRCFIPKVR